MKTILKLNFRSIFVNTTFIITKGLILCFHQLAWLAVGALCAILFIFFLFYVLAGLACFALTALVVLSAILFFIFRINYIKNNKIKYVDSKYAFVFFKVDWVNIHILAIAKFISIYLVNIKNGQLDINTLLLNLSAFYILLILLASDTVINRMFTIQQGLILINKGFNDMCSIFNNDDGTTPSQAPVDKNLFQTGYNYTAPEQVRNSGENNVENGILESNSINHTAKPRAKVQPQLEHKRGGGKILKLCSIFGGLLNNNNINKKQKQIRGYSTNANTANNNTNEDKIKHEVIKLYETKFGKSKSNKKDKYKLKKNEKDILTNLIGSVGFRSYNSLFVLGNLLELLNDRGILNENLARFLSSL